MREKVTSVVESKLFERSIITVILVNAVVLGLETSQEIMNEYGHILEVLNYIFITIFVIEMLLKLYAYHFNYFRDGWNVFDFIIVFSSLIPTGGVFTGLRILRIFRVLRIPRLISGLKPLRKIVSSILRSLPGVAWTVLLMFIVYYVFAIIGIYLFSSDAPEKFGSLGTAFVTLFELMTLSSWQNVVIPLTEHNVWAWFYFLIFILAAAFILLNVILGIIVDSLDLQNKEEELEIIEAALEPDASKEEILQSEVLKLKVQLDQIITLMEHKEGEQR